MKILYIFLIMVFLIIAYHAYTVIGIYVYSLHAFRFAKKLQIYPDIKCDYDFLIKGFHRIGLDYNNTLYKRIGVTLLRPEMDLFLLTNGIYKFRVVVTGKINGAYDIALYFDPISIYFLFFPLLALPLTIILNAVDEMNYLSFSSIIEGLVGFCALIILLRTIVFFLERRLMNKYIQVIDSVIETSRISG